VLKRLPYNSSVLQENFPEMYRQFFTPCQRVASASLSFLWAGEFSGFHDGLMMGQKLPLQLYVGFESTNTKRVVVNNQYHAYSAHSGQFEPQTLDSHLSKILEQYLTEYFAKDAGFNGINVHFLAEVPFGHSLGSHGAIAASLALLLVPQKSEFDPLFKHAQHILSLIQSGHSSGLSAFMALTDLDGPVVFGHTKNDYVAQPLYKLAHMKHLPSWPFDYALIYTGSQVDTESVVRASLTSTTELDQVASDFTKLLPKHALQNYTQTFMNMLNMSAGLSIHGLLSLFAKGPSRDRLERFFNTMNQYQNLFQVLDVNNPAIDQIYAAVHTMSNKQINEVGSGVKISGVGKGGVMICAVPYGTYRTKLPEVIEKLATSIGRELCLDYASWIDGHNTLPGQIEQDIAHNQYSSFVSQDSVTLLRITKGQKQELIFTKEQYEHDLGQFDIVFDHTTEKVIIGGKSITSKDLPSQKAAVAIMSQLINDPQFALSNSLINDSYGVNRYDLQGKIVIPLIRTVKKLTGRDLQLRVHGDMYDNYTLSLNPSNMIIGVVESKR